MRAIVAYQKRLAASASNQSSDIDPLADDATSMCQVDCTAVIESLEDHFILTSSYASVLSAFLFVSLAATAATGV